MPDQPAMDQAKAEAFVHRVLGDTSAALTTTLAALGDRLGLFKDLAANGPATSAEVAARTGIHERYAREWLGGMANAGYVAYDPASHRFGLTGANAGKFTVMTLAKNYTFWPWHLLLRRV
jgi:hypothetical protein